MERDDGIAFGNGAGDRDIAAFRDGEGAKFREVVSLKMLMGLALELALRIMLGPYWSWRQAIKWQNPVHLQPHPEPYKALQPPSWPQSGLRSGSYGAPYHMEWPLSKDTRAVRAALRASQIRETSKPPLLYLLLSLKTNLSLGCE